VAIPGHSSFSKHNNVQILSKSSKGSKKQKYNNKKTQTPENIKPRGLTHVRMVSVTFILVARLKEDENFSKRFIRPKIGHKIDFW